MIVYIDGENLRHRLKDVLVQEGRIDETEDSFPFRLAQMIQDKLGKKPDEIIYYTTKQRKLDRKLPKRVQDNLERINIASRSWLSRLQNQGITIIKAGYLNIRETGKCLHCGKTTLVPQEKGVDVRLAIDILEAAIQAKKQDIVVISSDTDLLPAFQAVSFSRANLIYMTVDEYVNRALSGAANKTIVIQKSDIINAHELVKK